MFYVEYWMYRFAWNGHMQWHLTINDGVTTNSKGMCGNHNGDPHGTLHCRILDRIHNERER